MTPGRQIRVLIADDSPVMRDMLALLLSDDPRIEVVGRAPDGKLAIELACKLRPDVIMMDVVMPGVDGLAATSAIMRQAPTRVIIVSGLDDLQQDLSFRAIAAGALEVVRKPSSSEGADITGWGRRIAETVRVLSEVPVVRRFNRAPSVQSEEVPGSTIDVVGIAASTGGPRAVATILTALPANLPIPVLLAQHLASSFTDGFARWLGGECKLKVRVARHDEMVQAGHVYLPPDGHHLEVSSEGQLIVSGDRGGIVPSGDRLLASLAAAYRSRACGIVLTGMGEDGADGLLKIRRAGGAAVAQSEETCVVFGMPRAARDRGATDQLFSPEHIAAYIKEHCRTVETDRRTR